eukprot:scaffold68022_cov43-Attheya_sp.AAC.1
MVLICPLLKDPCAEKGTRGGMRLEFLNGLLKLGTNILVFAGFGRSLSLPIQNLTVSTAVFDCFASGACHEDLIRSVVADVAAGVCVSLFLATAHTNVASIGFAWLISHFMEGHVGF